MIPIIDTDHHGYNCRFGKTLFFEHPISNPFGHEERFLLSLHDSELRLVSSFEEWMHLRHTCRPCSGELGPEPSEVEMFDKVPICASICVCVCV